MEQARVSVPKTARKGEIIQVKTLISHPMESGQRQDAARGGVIPRKIIPQFVCTYNGEEVFWAAWYPAIAANPYMAFYLVATESGVVECRWTDDDGVVYTQSASLTVS